jgi:hypothetical protein
VTGPDAPASARVRALAASAWRFRWQVEREAEARFEALAGRLDAYRSPTEDASDNPDRATHDAARLAAGVSELFTAPPAPASRESVVGAPLAEDFGAELLATVRRSALSTWQRADLIEQAFNEWNSEGPSPRAARRLHKILQPGYVATPQERKGAVILDALALHLIDRGRYAPLVRDYIDSLKRSGDHERLVDAMLQDYPDETREWADGTLQTILLILNEPLPAALRGDDDPPDRPAFNLDTRILKLFRLLNCDAQMGLAAAERE